MRIIISEKQFKKIVLKSIGNQELSEEGEEGGTPESGASSDGEKKTGATKWESGVTRGPANQIGNTKWSDIVGAQLKRGKANPLKEQQVRNTTIGPARGFEGDPNYVPFLDGPDLKDPYRRSKTDPIILKYPNFFKGPMAADVSFGQDKSRGTKSIEDKPPFYVYSKARNSWDLVNSPNAPNVSDGHRTVNIGPFMKRILEDYFKFNAYRDPQGGLKKNLTNSEILFLVAQLSYNPIANYFTPEVIKKLDTERYFDRISKTGKDVPKGYDPDLYDEYLTQRNPIEAELNKLKKQQVTPASTERAKVLGKQLLDLEKKYYNKYFSYGLPPDQYELFLSRMENLNKIYEPKLRSLSMIKERMPKIDNTYIVKTGIPNIVADEYSSLLMEYNSEVARIRNLFGYDYLEPQVSWFGEKFDKWWDEWGNTVQIVGNIIIVVGATILTAPAGGTGGAAAATWLSVSSNFLRAAAPYIADATFNAFVGSYQVSRGQDEQALISFVCAMLPFASYAGDVGKVSYQASAKLAQKIAIADLSSKDKIIEFVRGLSETERYIFRNAGSMPKRAIKEQMDIAVKNVATQIKKTQKSELKTLGKAEGAQMLKQTSVARVGAKIWGPPLLKQFGLEGGVPLAIGLANRWLGIIRDKTGRQFNAEEIRQIKEALKQLSDEEKLMFWYENIVDENKAVDPAVVENAPNMVKKVKEFLKKQISSELSQREKVVKKFLENEEKWKRLKSDATTPPPYEPDEDQ